MRRRLRARFWTRRALILLTLGILTNVAMIAFIIRFNPGRRDFTEDYFAARINTIGATMYGVNAWDYDRLPQLPTDVTEWVDKLESRDWVKDLGFSHADPTVDTVDIIILTDLIGWPFRSAAAWSAIGEGGEVLATRGGWMFREPTQFWMEGPVHIPIAPRWRGLLANVAIYGAAWYVLLFAWRDTRRMVRRHRGRCPQCAYDLRGEFEKGCSECGWGRIQAIIR